jgi:hypothetical protein
MPATSGAPGEAHTNAWIVLSPHGFVLLYLAANPDSTLRDLSQRLGLTERRLHSVIKDLSSADMVRVEKAGRRNSYRVNSDADLAHPLFDHLRLGQFLDALRAG